MKKNDRYIEPNALRVFAHNLADIYISFEIYNLTLSENQEDSKYTAYFIVHAETGKKIAQFKRPKAIQGNSSAHSLKIPVEYFTRGQYKLTVIVRDELSGESVESSQWFTVLDNPVALLDSFHLKL